MFKKLSERVYYLEHNPDRPVLLISKIFKLWSRGYPIFRIDKEL